MTDWDDSPSGWVSASSYRLYKGRLYHLMARQGVNGSPFWPIVLDRWIQIKGEWRLPPWKNLKLARRLMKAVAEHGLVSSKEDVAAGIVPAKKSTYLGPLFDEVSK